MRFITTLFLTTLLTVSGLTHGHKEQQTLDVVNEIQQHGEGEGEGQEHVQIQQHGEQQGEQKIQGQMLSQAEIDSENELASLMEAEIERRVTHEVNRHFQRRAQAEAQGEEYAIPEHHRVPPEEKFMAHYIRARAPLDTAKLLMKEPALVRATNVQRQFNMASLVPYTALQLPIIRQIHDDWLKKLGWWLNSGYEFNWARMWEPVSKTYRSYVPSVKSQRCGTCWDFSTSAMISSHIAIKFGIDRDPAQWVPETVNPISLSEGELFECTAPGQDVCNGNWIQNAAGLVKTVGIAQNADYTFDGTLTVNAGKCRGNSCPGCSAPNPAPQVNGCNFWPQTCPNILIDPRRKDNPRFHISDLVTVTNPSSDTSPWTGSVSKPLQVEQIRDLLRTKGPVGFYFRVEGQFGAGGLSGQDVWPNNGAIYTTPCTGTGINHAMVIVGYGRTPSTNAQPNMDYWIVLNSWGNWSTDGFIKIKAGVNLCHAEQIAFYPKLHNTDLAELDPCASQTTEVAKLKCHVSICDNTMLSSSRYCQSKGRSNFCKRVKNTNACPNVCPPVAQTLVPNIGTCEATCNRLADFTQRLVCRIRCWTPFFNLCKSECRLYDRVCRPLNNAFDTILDRTRYADLLKPLNDNLLARTINPLTDNNIRIASVNTQPIRSFADVYRAGPINIVNTQTMVAQNGIVSPRTVG